MIVLCLDWVWWLRIPGGASVVDVIQSPCVGCLSKKQKKIGLLSLATKTIHKHELPQRHVSELCVPLSLSHIQPPTFSACKKSQTISRSACLHRELELYRSACSYSWRDVSIVVSERSNALLSLTVELCHLCLSLSSPSSTFVTFPTLS